MPDTLNQLWRDGLVQRNIFLRQYGTGLTNRLIDILDATERQLQRRVASAVSRMRDGVRASDRARLTKLATDITEIRGAAFRDMMELWRAELRRLGSIEAGFMERQLRALLQSEVTLAQPSLGEIGRLVRQPVLGDDLTTMVQRVMRNERELVMTQIRDGLARGESPAEIARRVFGSQTANGVDGVLNRTRQHVETLSRTMIDHVTSGVRANVTQSNTQYFSEEIFTAVLDGRTTPVCRSLDGNRYRIGEGPHPPLHFNCRSIRIPVLSPIGVARELGMTRRQARELVGGAPEETTYQTWLKRQPAAFQDEVLGPSRGALFRRGKLTLDRFVDRRGKQLTLDKLRKREPKAFRRANL